MTDWEARGCANLTPAESDRIFFPENNSSTRQAKELCSGCVIRTGCLAFGQKLSNGFGMWGGVLGRVLEAGTVTDAEIAVMSASAHRFRRAKAFTPEQIAKAREMRAAGQSLEQIGSQFECSSETIRRYTLDLPPAKRNGQMSDEDVIAIRQQLAADVPVRTVAANFGRSRKAIHNIITGVTYQHVAA